MKTAFLEAGLAAVVTFAGALGHQEGASTGSSVADVEHSSACQEEIGVLLEMLYHPD
jgi:hypothetical protein